MNAKPGFQFMLDAIGQAVHAGMRLSDAMQELLTLGGRMSIKFGIQSLTAAQRAMLEVAGDVPLSDTVGHASGASPWFLGVWNYGRVWLAPRQPTDPECRVLGAIDLPIALRAAVANRALDIQTLWSRCDSRMHDFFSNLDADAEKRVLHEVHEMVDHTDPVLLYIGDETITNFGKFNNLQERNADLPHCFHRRALHTPSRQWSTAERIYVYCFHILHRAGCRGEEFNGRQLNPALLDEYLDQRLERYAELAPQLFGGRAATLEEKADLLARCKKECESDMLTWRWINGLNFYKEERLSPRGQMSPDAGRLPPALRMYLAEICDADPARHGSFASLFAECVANMARAGFTAGEDGMHPLERLLRAIVESAIEATGSDVGMTRGSRHIDRLQKAFAEQRHDEICAWPAADYYCAVFPGKALLEHLRHAPDMLVKILYACSGRMQFNHWHYMPGHCPRESVPADRHFYVPPRMPDIAVWTDQHHAGHVLAEVRYSIRSPAPLVFNGREFPGMIDLRLFRRSGTPYGEEELRQMMLHTECLRALMQAVSDHVAGGAGAVSIDAFDKDWYRSHYTALCAVMPAVGELMRLLHGRAGDHVALVEARQSQADVEMSYATLFAHALALRQAARGHGIGAGACIAILSQRPLHQAVAIVAGIANGMIVNPLNPQLACAVLNAQLRHAQPAWLLVDEHAGDGVADNIDVPEGTRRMAWHDVFATADGIAPDAELLAALADAANPADEAGGLLIYTSGTTGNSKGVPLNWKLIAANVRHAIGALGFAPGWVSGSLLPRFHTFTLISDLFPALFQGGKTVLVDSFDLRHVRCIVDAFLHHGVQSYSAAPIILEVLSGLRAWADAPAMRFAVAGAAPLKDKTRIAYLEAFGHPIIPCYGLSETTCFAAISPPDMIRPGAVGLPAGIEIKVVDEHGASLGPDEAGELLMRGPSVIGGGYFNDHEGQFAAAFTPDGWFKTGDIGRIDGDGYVYVTGRKKNMVIRGGEKVYLEDVDRCLADCLGVIDCASIVRCRPQEADQALTFIVTGGAPLTKDEIAAHVRAGLTAQHVPDRVYVVERIPRTPSGKASHPELMALAARMDEKSGGAA
jgi:acyl-CoA synthetase (AMP-forming)/AMP-acid ligase II